MTYEFWIKAEDFLNVSFYTRLFLLGFLLIIIISRLTFLGEKRGRGSNIFWSIVILTFLGISMNTTIKFNKYKKLYDYDKYVNYGMRDYKRVIYTYKGANLTERTLYKDLYLVDNFRMLPIYDEEDVIEDVEFLGRDGDRFYFQDHRNISFRELGNNLEIVDNLSNPIREGIRFKLKDPRFLNIGFKEESPRTYLLTYKIPKDMENKKFENPDDIEVLKQDDFTLGWINTTFSNRAPMPENK